MIIDLSQSCVMFSIVASVVCIYSFSLISFLFSGFLRWVDSFLPWWLQLTKHGQKPQTVKVQLVVLGKCQCHLNFKNIKFLLNEWVILPTIYQNLILVVFIDHLHKINLFLIFPQCLSTSLMASVAEHFLAIWSLLSLSLLDSSAVLYGWSWELYAPTVANRQWYSSRGI